MTPFDIERFRKLGRSTDQYEIQLKRLRDQKKSVTCIEKAVDGAMLNLKTTEPHSFVIYGEPQSGKTEMMICLTAKLLDEGYQFIIHLLNDSVDLLDQNLGRFQASGLSPAAKSYKDIIDPAITIKDRKFVIFCKKNAQDLKKLYDKIGAVRNIVIIDDEADFASPNAKVNKNEQTRINGLISSLLENSGDYIGVTATPARLDLNNTFDNDNTKWVDFPPHKNYTGQDHFFPLSVPGDASDLPYRLTLLPDEGDDPKHARTALLSFLANVAHINEMGRIEEKNYSMLVHTSGKKVDHKADWASMESVLKILVERKGAKFDQYVKELWDIVSERFPSLDPNEIVEYVIKNVERNRIIVLNSDKDFKTSGSSATMPSALFTIIIGGNIVSRGVTFDNLLSMFFTRDVKHKIQQDTYIQRARMFGARGDYLNSFELTIPKKLYADWHRCFVFHRLALSAIRDRLGSPVWVSDKRIAVAASSSIDKATVDLNRGEMAFQRFSYKPELDDIATCNDSSFEKMLRLRAQLGEASFPDYLIKYITQNCSGNQSLLAIHSSYDISGYKDSEVGLDKEAIERKKGFFGTSQMQLSKFPSAIHHIRIFRNQSNMARLFYKQSSGSIAFIRNLK